MADATSTILENLRRIQTEGGDGNFVIFELPSGDYVQFAGENGGTRLYGEASHDEISETQRLKLESLGWQITPDDYNYNREWHTNTESGRKEVVDFVMNTLKTVYGFKATDTLTVNLNLE